MKREASMESEKTLAKRGIPGTGILREMVGEESFVRLKL